jgi:hypothetical protein
MSKFTDLRDAIELIFTHLWDFLLPFLKQVEAGGVNILLPAAESAVAVGFSTPGDGTVKMAAALASFSAEVVGKGLPFIESEARTLIELALQKAKAAAPASAA